MKKLLCSAAIALGAWTISAQTIPVPAGVIYTARPVYDLAHFGNYVIDFNNFTPAPPQYASVTAPTPIGDVSFDVLPTSNNIEFLGNDNFPFLGPGNLVLYNPFGNLTQDSLIITLPANTFSFGLDLIDPVSNPAVEDYKITVFSGATPLDLRTFGVSPSTNTGYTFFGFDSATAPITSIALQITNLVGSGAVTIDNFTVVPEPSTWLAGGLSLLVIAYSQRRRLGRLANSK